MFWEGQLANFLNLFGVDHAKRSDASYDVEQNFSDDLEMFISNIEIGLILPMADRRANKKIIVHGDDHVTTRPVGPRLDLAFNAGLYRPSFDS